jgi:putative transposase
VTDVTEDRAQDGAGLSAADEQLRRELRERARTGGLKLAGEGGLLGKLTKMVVEGALEGEMDDHLGYSKHDPAGHPIHPGSNLEIRLAYEQSGTYTGAFPADLNISVRRFVRFRQI